MLKSLLSRNAVGGGGRCCCFLKQQRLNYSSKLYPSEAVLVEVGPRDGLQNEKQIVATEKKIEFINRLSDTGLRRIEATSFVSPKWVPQFADAKKVMSEIRRHSSVRYSTLTPNLKGFNDAVSFSFFKKQNRECIQVNSSSFLS